MRTAFRAASGMGPRIRRRPLRRRGVRREGCLQWDRQRQVGGEARSQRPGEPGSHGADALPAPGFLAQGAQQGVALLVVVQVGAAKGIDMIGQFRK